MAVTFTEYLKEYGRAIITVGVGTTVETHVNNGVRIMSDVWDSQRVVTYLASQPYGTPVYGHYVGRTSKPTWKTVTTSLYEFTDRSFTYEIDADEATLALWKTELAERARLTREAEAKQAADPAIAAARYARATRLAKGAFVTVIKGRKVPKGTAGKVIWVGDGRYGARVGLVDIDGDVHWTAASNVRVEALTPETFRRIDAGRLDEYRAAKRA